VPGFATDVQLDPSREMGVILLSNAYDFPLHALGSESTTRNVFDWVGSAIAKATSAEHSGRPTKAEYAAYEGMYSSYHGDLAVASKGDGLAMFDPRAPKPMMSVIRLVPAGEHAFEVEQAGGFRTPGELVVFDLDQTGRAVILREGSFVFRRVPEKKR
jgi:hypothetical protein